ncbi:trinucleotide repeat-containing gene 6C protein-like [Gadus chalcogrammus]|uniref:trinucleotide repeat-containing gene 6C protein-like n=1 Tax=Gadus chalcogrammus TaxID=1042646 RepID=UPI0024C37880|nr:trinucleotide repeat-containing gene 6C protein-like [Gadus chalcogrammus]
MRALRAPSFLPRPVTTKWLQRHQRRQEPSEHFMATEQKTKVPDSAPAPSALLSVTAPCRGDGSSAPYPGQPQAPPAPPPSAQRHPPRDVPPRFRQQEHKQLLKRGQPLPPGLLTLPPQNPAASESPLAASLSSATTTEASAAEEQASSSSSSPASSELPPKSGQGAQYSSPFRGHQPANQSVSGTSLSTNPSGWDQPIIDQRESEALPSINHSESRDSQGGCPTGADPSNLARDSSNSSASMATGANGQTGNYPASHTSSKANSGPSPANQSGANMLSNQAAANRSWGSGPGSGHCPPQSSMGGEGKSDVQLGAGVMGWGSSSSTSNFNLNLNPNANPSAWPALGHDGAGTGGGTNPSSPPQPLPTLCNLAGGPTAQANGSTGANANGNASGSGSAWGGTMPSDPSEPHPPSSTNVSFSSEPQSLNTDGQNHTNKQEPPSPMRNMPGWGGGPVGVGPRGHSQPGAPQVNGEDGSAAWGSGEPKTAPSKEASGWDSGSNWGLRGGAGGCSGGWGKQQSSGDWAKQGATEAPGGWDAPGSPPQDQKANSWGRAHITAVTSEGSSDNAEGLTRCPDRPSREEVPPALPAADVDPRVLCNTGWGQTPVRQHTSWDMIEKNRKAEKAAESWGSRPSTCSDVQGPSNTNMAPSQRSDPVSKSDGPEPQGAPGWGGGVAPTNQTSSGWGDQPSNKKPPPGGPGGWGNSQPGGVQMNVPKNAGPGWGEEKPASWEDPQNKTKAQGWGETPKASPGWGKSGGNGGGGDWETDEKQKENSNPNTAWEGEAGGWKENPRSWSKPAQGTGLSGRGGAGGGGGWTEPASQHPTGPTPGSGVSGGGGWAEPASQRPTGQTQGSGASGGGGWAEPASQRPTGPAQGSGASGGGGWGEPASQRPTAASGGGGWGEPDNQRSTGPAQGWGGKNPDVPNGRGGGGGGMGSWSGPGLVKQSGSWSGKKPEPPGSSSGWEEPSPPSIRRKMEIDDGTAAWGDPGTYSKALNLWDRNNQGKSQGKAPQGGSSNPPAPSNNHGQHHHPHAHSHPYHGGPPPPAVPSHSQTHPPQNPSLPSGPLEPSVPHQTGPSPHSRTSAMNQGWGEIQGSHAKPEGSWGDQAPQQANADNGASTWGKSSGGWGEVGPESYSRGNQPIGSASCKPAPKPMQDSWAGGDEEQMGMSGGQWDPDEGDAWNSGMSQENNSSCNSWSNGPKKGLQKMQGKIPGKQEEAWMLNRLIKQLTEMGFPRDPAEEALKTNNMNLDQAMSVLLEKKLELDKRGMGMAGHDYSNGLINKALGGPRPPLLSKDPPMDRRSPFMDKAGIFGSGGPAQGRALHHHHQQHQQHQHQHQQHQQHQQQAPPPQPPVPPPGSSQPGLRAQVPQILSPQVQAQLLQFAAKNIGLNPALLTSPINPQHMTLLNQLYQLQLAYQRLQIQQQMLQAQRNVSGPIRQQEQQVARTITNMQQQIQQHQRQLAQALLMKQQPPPPTSHAGLHPGSVKSALDSFPGHPHASGLPDLQTKEPQSSPHAYSTYPHSGLNPNMNVNLNEVGGGLSMKEHSQPQSRLSQWTHPNSMDTLSGGSSPLEHNLAKHANLGSSRKSPQMEDSYSAYSLHSDSPSSPPDHWGSGKSSNDKMANGTNITWPPEFCPGVPWKGLQSIDPETDPNMTPGSVPNGPTINTNIQDVNRYLLRDRSGGSSPTSSQTEALTSSSDWPVSSYSSSFSLSSPEMDDAGKLPDMKSTWSPGAISNREATGSLSHELWKVPHGPRNSAAPSRPPPGLTHTKPPPSAPSSSTWGGNSLGLGQSWSSSYTSAGNTWSTDSSSRGSSWLVLRNLTPQIDGSTLRTLCMQHGPLITFHLNLTQGNAVVRYSSRDEAAKAQKSLHMCVLGNTTILAEFAGEEEVARFFAQGQSLGATTSWQANPSGNANQARMGGGGGPAHPIGHHAPHWGHHNSCSGGNGAGGLGGGGSKAGGGDMLWGGGGPQYSSLWGPPGGGEDGQVMGSPTPINTLLPGDLLSGESM